MQKQCVDQLKKKSLHLQPHLKLFSQDLGFTDDEQMHKLQTKLEVFEEEVIGRQKEMIRACVGLQKETIQLQRRLNEMVSQASLDL